MSTAFWILSLVCLAVATWLGVLVLSTFVSARRRRAHYQSGERLLVEQAVAEELATDQAPPQLRALAWAGLGDLSRARRALLAGPVEGEERRELQLCTRVLVEAFEGRVERALCLCRDLLEVPLSHDDGVRGRRRLARREGTIALARAVGGCAESADFDALLAASRLEPTLYWASRYAAAVACDERREPDRARWLVRDAPRWPKESIYRRLHEQLGTGAQLIRMDWAVVA